MDWNAKWDWETLEMFTSKDSDHKQNPLMDWDIIESNNSTPFNCGSSATSTDSQPSLKKASHGSSESLTCLKLGKRTYFENDNNLDNVHKIASSTSSEIPLVSCSSSPTDMKKNKSYCQSPPNPRCQVEGCNLDLSSAKEYHRKHRVCEKHSKSSKVVIRGLERRFCQQCSRFHNLSEFDEKKRSCRRRLSDHNARRRKPQHETIHFNSTRACSSFYDERQQMGFMLNNTRFDPKLADRKPNFPAAVEVSQFNLSHSKGTDTTYQGAKDAMFCNSNSSDSVPDLHRALSLLSTNYHPESSDTLENTNHVILPLDSPPMYWQASHQYPADAYMDANGNSSNTQFQLFTTGFYTNSYM